jgi:2-methylcitrate dehydratase
MVAAALIFGRLTADDYEDAVARDPRIDSLRAQMQIRENAAFTRDYYDPEKRFIGNAVQVFFKDGTSTERVEVSVPIGHRLRRAEGLPLLEEKFRAGVGPKLAPERFVQLDRLCHDPPRLQALPVDQFMSFIAR